LGTWEIEFHNLHPGTHWLGGGGCGSQSRSGLCARTNSCLCQEPNRDTSVFTPIAYSPYRLNYILCLVRKPPATFCLDYSPAGVSEKLPAVEAPPVNLGSTGIVMCWCAPTKGESLELLSLSAFHMMACLPQTFGRNRRV
jgi:hypothetical protein